MNDPSSDEPAAMAVIKAVADKVGIDPVDLTDPLSDAIDPDALDAVCRYSSAHVTFEYHGYFVTVDSTNQVELSDAHRG